MLSRRIAERYAEALFDLALQQHTVDIWATDLQTLTNVFAASSEMEHFLTHPEIPLARKETVIRQILQGKIAPEVMATLLLLLKRGHDPDMATLLDVYRDLWNRHTRILPVTVTTAVPLEERQVSALTMALVKRTGRTVKLQREVDPSLVAGMIITMGDRVIDASARASLDQLRDVMRG